MFGFLIILPKCWCIFLVASLTPACETLVPPIYSEAMGCMAFIPQLVLKALHLWLGLNFLWSLGGTSKANSVVLQLVVVVRHTRNGRSFPPSRRPLTPERKTGHWLKFPWRNQAPLRLGPIWWTLKCTRWISAVCPHRDLLWDQTIRLGEKMRWKMEPCTRLSFHYMDSRSGEGNAVLSAPSLSAEHQWKWKRLPFTSGTKLYSEKLVKSQNVSEVVEQ